MPVTRLVQRRHHVLVEARAFLEHGLRGLEAGVLQAGHARDLRDVGEMLDVEEHVLDGGDVAHGCLQCDVGEADTKRASRTMPWFLRWMVSRQAVRAP
jgi:hypothetical protein